MKWEAYFMNLAHNVALKSKDTTKVGCVIVGEDNQILTTGWNGLARGVLEHPERHERPEKYDWTVHAEANAIANAARSGTALKGSMLYCTHKPCTRCAGLIINAGIKCIVYDGSSILVGNHETDKSDAQFREAGVTRWMLP